MISCSWLPATSACADTRSSGGDEPTSTFALFTRTSSCASSRADRRASTLKRADTRFQHAAFTLAVVWTRLSVSLRVGDVPVGSRHGELLPGAIDEHIAEERLRHVQRSPD